MGGAATRTATGPGTVDLDAVIEAVLGPEAHGGRGRWRVPFGAVCGTVVLDDEWLALEAPWRGSRKLVPFGVLEGNSALCGNAKHVMLESGVIRLRSEIPLRGVPLLRANGIAQTMQEAAEGIAGGAGSTGWRSPALRTGGSARHGDGPSLAVIGLCEESGWPYAERKGGLVVIDLEVTGSAFFQASVVRGASGRIRLGVELARADDMSVSDPRIVAASALLLRVGALVRMVRTVAQRSDGRLAVGLDVELPPAPSCAVFVHALSALSVACGECAREVEALLEDDVLASAYLEALHSGRRWARRGMKHHHADGREESLRGGDLHDVHFTQSERM